MWLQEDVLQRRCKITRKADAQAGERPKLGYSAVKMCVTAVVDLWQDQHQRGENTVQTQNPRSANVRTLLQSCRRMQNERRRRAFHDRGAGSVLDGYNESQLERILSCIWAQNDRNTEHGFGPHSTLP